jgi:pantoate--beta-alanine ligase
VFVPSVAVIYPAGFQTAVIVDQVTRRLEGELRPGHFRGVTTVVAKLFNLTQPTCAYFGQKDAQQVAVLRQMVRDLNFPLQMVVVPTVRETDGLALSSRNVYLKPDEREAARALYRALQAAASLYDAGERDTETLRLEAMDMLNAQELAAVDYVSVLDARTFQPVEGDVDALLIVVLAAKIGRPRLLDNALLPWSLNSRDGLTATLGAGVP